MFNEQLNKTKLIKTNKTSADIVLTTTLTISQNLASFKRSIQRDTATDLNGAQSLLYFAKMRKRSRSTVVNLSKLGQDLNFTDAHARAR